MNVLFLTMYPIRNLSEHGIYEDLVRRFTKANHNIFIVTPCERREGISTSLDITEPCVQLLRVKTLNVQKSNVIEKGIGQLLLERQFKLAITNILETLILI